MFLITVLGCFNSVFASTITSDGGEIGSANFNNTAENSAIVGCTLYHPEVGWTRYDDQNGAMNYFGSGWIHESVNNRYYDETISTYKESGGSGVLFRFKGTKLRVISNLSDSHVKVMIDGRTCDCINNNGVNGELVFESDTFQNEEHKVSIWSDEGFSIDAIDIKDGNINTPATTNSVNLNKTTDALMTGQTDTLTASVLPDDAKNKTVTWSSSDSSIASVDNSGKITAVKAGQATIMATTVDGKKASCTVTVTDTPAGQVKLTIYMPSDIKREYYLTQDQLNDFLNWYNDKASGKTNTPTYKFNVSGEDQYIVFDKIITFNVDH
ncbi:Ig-like domain-containing protein [Clostridium felsineum]|uniref:Ig-like domain-containing protein n=1 Tax=Clostridium felsineum TaxID=36839 RepID=UPI00214DB1D0|nr:Ig-like domain-containing protein [Clostridium felsineum]MCR3758259.1 Ig-like domain-containing protein [Clostridium felsineum]